MAEDVLVNLESFATDCLAVSSIVMDKLGILMCPLVRDEFRVGNVSFIGGGGIRRFIEDRNNYHLGFGIVLFQVRDFSKVVGMEHGSQGTALCV